MRLELRQKQKQILTEKMIQSVEILQMTSQELKEYVNEVMLENPVVELDEHVNENTGTEDKTGKLGETGIFKTISSGRRSGRDRNT